MVRDSGKRTKENGHGAADPFEALRLHIAEIKEYAGYLSGLKKAKLIAKLRSIALAGIAGAAGLLLAATAAVIGVVLMMLGLAHAIASATGRPWLGEIIVGGGVLILLGGTVAMAFSKVKAKARRKTMLAFEGRKEKQRARFHRSIDQAAASEVGGSIPRGRNPADSSRDHQHDRPVTR